MYIYDICILNRLKLLNVRHARRGNSGKIRSDASKE
jgi:hypothetical protein